MLTAFTKALASIALVIVLAPIAWGYALPQGHVVFEDRPLWTEQLPYPVYWWNSQGMTTRAIVVLIHGFAMHAHMYDRLAEYLAERGFAVAAIDMRGYGERRQGPSGCTKQDHTIDYNKSLSDLELLLTQARENNPNLPIFIVGESLGASMTIRLAARRPDIAGIVLSSPALLLKKSVAVKNFPCVLVHLGVPNGSLNLSHCITKLVADEPQVRSEAAADSLIRRKFPMRDVWKTLRFMHQTISFCPSVPPNVPAYIIETSNDTLLSERGAYKIFRALSSENKKLDVFDEKAHVLLETRYVRPDVLESVYRWLTDACGLAGSHTSSLESSSASRCATPRP